MAQRIRLIRLPKNSVLQAFVPPAVSATLKGDRLDVMVVPESVHDNGLLGHLVCILVHLHLVQLLLAELPLVHPRDVLPRLDAAVGPVEGNAPPFEGGVGGQRVIDRHVVGVLNLGRHLIVDIDVVPEEAVVPNVPVVVLVVDVEVHEVLVLSNVPVEVALVGVRARAAFVSSKGVVASVVLEVAVRHHLARLGLQPPV